MDAQERKALLLRIKKWFADEIVETHLKRTEKLKDIQEFDINPFLVTYLAKLLGGSATPENIARALVYPRALGTSINTSFGQRIQSFISTVLGAAFGSAIPGMDIEFTDAVDGKKKYCQMKLGPNTINNDDVTTVANKFNDAKRLARTNNLRIPDDDFVVGVMFGEKSRANTFYQQLERDHHFTLSVGQEFWHRLTGDTGFYALLIEACSEAAKEFGGNSILEDAIKTLSKNPEIIRLSTLAE